MLTFCFYFEYELSKKEQVEIKVKLAEVSKVVYLEGRL